MIFDALLLILAVLAFLRGWQKGLLWAIFSFIAVLVGVMVSLKLSHVLASYFYAHHFLTGKYTLLLCFVLIFITIMILFRSGIKLIESLLDKLMLGWVNKSLGGMLYAGFVVLLFSLFTWLAGKSGLLTPELKKDSFTFPYVEPAGPKFIAIASEYLPLCKNLYQDIMDLIAKAGEKYQGNLE